MNDTLRVVNTSGLHPQGHAVLVKPYEPERKESLIALPPAAKERSDMVNQRAVVIECGPAAWVDEPQPRARPGDHVLITRFAGFIAYGDMTKDGQTYRLVNDRDVFCTLET